MAIPLSRRLDFSEIPQIDVGVLLAGDSTDGLIDALESACTDVGFFYVHNHGVAPELISELREQASLYFNQPMADKMKLAITPQMRGYLPLDYSSYEGEERAAKSHQEGFWVGYDRPLSSERAMEGPNVWPDYPPGLKTAMLNYFEAVERLSVALQRGFAMALGLGETGLDAHFIDPMSLLKLNHYPPQDAPESVKHIGVVPHSDSGAFTILWQDDGEGLEIENKNGEWIGAPSIPDTFVINIGNVMQIWTDGRFSSTPHRVINRGGRDRYSIPFFVNPGRDAPIGPLENQAAEPAEPFSKYIQERLRRTFPVAQIPEYTGP
ncbi:MAG: isopenicillin N synthase family oxygenase [Rhizobiales bacterium]|nr:isopenicillin N synthase family oxygenase [Hyphomicrobiales bacterium]